MAFLVYLKTIGSWPPEFYEDWQAPVGTGLVPVHGPAPEPATLGLMLLGGLAVLRRKRS